MNGHDPNRDAMDEALRRLLGPVDQATIDRTRIRVLGTIRGEIAGYFGRNPEDAARSLLLHTEMAERASATMPAPPAPRHWPTIDREAFRACTPHGRLLLARETIKKFCATWGSPPRPAEGTRSP